MPALNKQTLINLLIDSPLREPIKINLIDIVNNTNDIDLPKTYSTISKELEIFQKATERRMKLADETIAKLKEDGGEGTSATAPTAAPSADTSSLPPLPPLPTPPTPPLPQAEESTGLSVPSLDLPPLPKMNTSEEPAQATPVSEPVAKPTTPVEPATTPEPSTPLPPPVQSTPAVDADEDALKQIQQELDSLKSTAAQEAAPAVSTPQA